MNKKIIIISAASLISLLTALGFGYWYLSSSQPHLLHNQAALVIDSGDKKVFSSIDFAAGLRKMLFTEVKNPLNEVIFTTRNSEDDRILVNTKDNYILDLPGAEYIKFTEDFSHLYYETDENKLFVVDLATKETTEYDHGLSDVKADFDFDPFLGRKQYMDDQYMYYTLTGNKETNRSVRQLLVTNRDTKEVVFNKNVNYGWVLTDENTIFYEGKNNIYFYNLNTGKGRKILDDSRFTTGNGTYYVFSSNGYYDDFFLIISYYFRPGPNIFAINDDYARVTYLKYDFFGKKLGKLFEYENFSGKSYTDAFVKKRDNNIDKLQSQTAQAKADKPYFDAFETDYRQYLPGEYADHVLEYAYTSPERDFVAFTLTSPDAEDKIADSVVCMFNTDSVYVYPHCVDGAYTVLY